MSILHIKIFLRFRMFVLSGMLLLALPLQSSHAQVTTTITVDGTLNTQISQNGNIHDITGGTRPGEGPNLFHSFGQFNIGDGDVARFTGPSGIENILSRVTGGEPSNIFGMIESTIDNANLYLMNPAGVIFGPTASLDVSGSFHVTTADYIRLSDNVQFKALPGLSDAVLSTAPVAAFGFLSENPASITYSGTFDDGSVLGVHEDKTLSFIGGDIHVAGDGSFDTAILEAPSGQINLVSVKSSGEAVLDTALSFEDFNVETFDQLGDITLTEGTLLDVIFGSESGGTVVIRSGRLVMNDSAVFADTENINGAPIGIDVFVQGEFSAKDSFLTTDVFGTGDAGSIRIEAGTMHFEGTPNDDPDNASGRIGSLAFGSGKTGNIDVMVKNTLRLEGRAEITTSTDGPGNSGNITVSATNMFISGTSSSNPFTTGGIAANTSGSGNGGLIQITGENIELSNQGTIQSGSSSTGDAAGVNISITGNLELREGSFILGDSDGTGKAANINISAKNVSIIGIQDAPNPNDRFQGTFTGLDSSTESAGEGGNVTVLAESLKMTDQGIIKTSTEGTGAGGNIDVTVSQTLSLSEGASITAESTFVGDNAGTAGNINLNAKDTISINNSTITAQADNAFGGNIKLKAENLIQITNSEITSKVQEGSANAGSINIDPQFIVVKNSRIDTSANIGNGGDVSFVADSAILIDPFSTIDTSSQFGGSGNIDIRAPVQNLSGTIAPLPEEILKVSGLFAARCAAHKGGQFSSFVQDRSVRNPLGATGFLSSPLKFDRFESQQPLSVARLESPTSFNSSELRSTTHSTFLIRDPAQGCTPIIQFRS